MAWLAPKKRKNPKTGRKETYWTLAWREQSQVRTRAIGFCTKDEAKRALKVVEGRLAVGDPVDPPPAEPPPVSNSSSAMPTLREYLDDTFLPVVRRDKAVSTYKTRRTSANALIAKLGARRLDKITYALVDTYITQRKVEGRRSRTVILELTCLGQALDHAADSGVLARAPKLPRIADRDRQPHRFLTEEQSIRLLDALRPLDVQPRKVTRGAPPVRRDSLTYLAVLMALNAGMRRNEILTRTWSDIRWNQGELGAIVVGAKPQYGFQVKTRRERTIPLTPELRHALIDEHVRAGQPDDDPLFPSPKNPEKPRQTFIRALKRACARAGVPEIHPHGLRHSWASRLAMAGVDRKALMELGGWKEGRMLDEVYAHVTDDHKAQVMARLGVDASARRSVVRIEG